MSAPLVQLRRGRLGAPSSSQIDGDTVIRAGGHHHPRRVPAAQARHFPRCAISRRCTPSTPVACASSRWRARACSCRRARAKWSPGWSCAPTPIACATAARWCSSFWPPRWTCRRRRTSRSGSRSTVAARSGTVRPRRQRRRCARLGAGGASRSARIRTMRRPSPARQGRQRAVRPRLRQVHSVLQVRRGLRYRLPEHVRDRRRRPWVRCAHLDRVRRPAARVGVRVLRQLYRRLSRRVRSCSRLSTTARAAGTWDESRQTAVDTICPYCGVGCTLTLHVQDNEIVKVTSPFDVSITRGNLCIKGRFGWQYVQHRGPTASIAEPMGRRRPAMAREPRAVPLETTGAHFPRVACN